MDRSHVGEGPSHQMGHLEPLDKVATVLTDLASHLEVWSPFQLESMEHFIFVPFS